MDTEQKIMRNIYAAVLGGCKPSGLFSRRWDLSEEDIAHAQQRGFDVIFGDTTVIIARPEKFTTLLSVNALQRFRTLGFGKCVNRLLAEIGEKSIGQTVAYLQAQPPCADGEYDVAVRNLERPEVTALLGIAFGYPPCDVEACIRVWYLGEDPSLLAATDPTDGHGLCPDCARRLLSETRSTS